MQQQYREINAFQIFPKFTNEIKSGKLPTNTEKLTYDAATGKLK
jgi:hypothetical protein